MADATCKCLPEAGQQADATHDQTLEPRASQAGANRRGPCRRGRAIRISRIIDVSHLFDTVGCSSFKSALFSRIAFPPSFTRVELRTSCGAQSLPSLTLLDYLGPSTVCGDDRVSFTPVTLFAASFACPGHAKRRTTLPSSIGQVESSVADLRQI